MAENRAAESSDLGFGQRLREAQRDLGRERRQPALERPSLVAGHDDRERGPPGPREVGKFAHRDFGRRLDLVHENEGGAAAGRAEILEERGLGLRASESVNPEQVE